MSDKLRDLIEKATNIEVVKSPLINNEIQESSNIRKIDLPQPVPFKPQKKEKVKPGKREIRIAANRFTIVRKQWKKIVTPIVEQLKLQVRMNTKERKVEIRTCKQTLNSKALQKASDFVLAVNYGFEVKDAVSLVRLDDVYLESFKVKDVKFSLKNDNLSRAVGRLAGSNGTTKYTIENATKTRIVIADTQIHIIGCFQNIKYARTALCDLILGSPPGVVYNKLRSLSQRLKESI